MSTEISNGPAKGDTEQRTNAARLDQASIREWLSTEVEVVLPRWGLLSAGLLVVGLLLIALD